MEVNVEPKCRKFNKLSKQFQNRDMVNEVGKVISDK